MKSIIQKSRKQPVIVQKNIDINPKFNVLEKTRLGHLDEVMVLKQKNAQKKAEQLLSNRRDKSIQGLGKWDDFRYRRDCVIKQYYQIRKMMAFVRKIVSQANIMSIFLWFKRVYQAKV
jgi:hypothetical protein